MEKLLRLLEVIVGKKRLDKAIGNLNYVVITPAETQKALPPVQKELHDKIPELIYWQEGDELSWSSYSNDCRNPHCPEGNRRSKGTYLGIYDGKIWIKQYNQILELPVSVGANGFKNTVFNDEGAKRYCQIREAQIRENISNDHYYHSLKVIREKGLHLLEPSVQTETV